MDPTYALIRHEKQNIWKSKEILRRLYFKWYKAIRNSMVHGPTLEIGGGSGNLKEHFPNAASSDLLFAKWLDAVLDAHHLPFKDETFSNIVLFDVLHHLKKPVIFLSDAKAIPGTPVDHKVTTGRGLAC